MAKSKFTAEERRKRNLENARRRYYERKKTGLCMYCPEKALPGKIRCQLHTEITADYNAARRDIRILQGLCERCGKQPATNGKRCRACALRESDLRRRSNQKRKTEKEVSNNA
ncbi:MAG: hypothetical protein M3209_09680 [Acidobacteriota bacterium]|nr:hypothetical protein [Acidobacteriota bacterium]